MDQLFGVGVTDVLGLAVQRVSEAHRNRHVRVFVEQVALRLGPLRFGVARFEIVENGVGVSSRFFFLAEVLAFYRFDTPISRSRGSRPRGELLHAPLLRRTSHLVSCRYLRFVAYHSENKRFSRTRNSLGIGILFPRLGNNHQPTLQQSISRHRVRIEMNMRDEYASPRPCWCALANESLALNTRLYRKTFSRMLSARPTVAQLGNRFLFARGV